MSFESFDEIIKFAIDKEIEAQAFYEDASKQESYAGAKATFQSFIAEEKKHENLLSRFLDGDIDLVGYKFEWIPDIKRSNFMVDFEYEPGMSYVDILRLAMKREEKSLDLYNTLAEKTDKEEAVKIFKMLSQEEAKHKLALETLYDDYMAEMGD